LILQRLYGQLYNFSTHNSLPSPNSNTQPRMRTEIVLLCRLTEASLQLSMSHDVCNSRVIPTFFFLTLNHVISILPSSLLSVIVQKSHRDALYAIVATKRPLRPCWNASIIIRHETQACDKFFAVFPHNTHLHLVPLQRSV
jgi:hypothetical protein